ncbi:uncharacterized protein LOC129566982 [Sitodiplosis mosellana]|uniref:uncharacterized protein LOC129566982 n=1 Tax=Sitodiplosis mosellana TaxID=263140 RepID=UPI002444BD17|nr:uncharacterized protein LOC129566982 [Sitodiplosis mosellana]
MALKAVNCLIFLIIARFASCSVKFEKISDCHFYDNSYIPGYDNVTFKCAENGNEQKIFLSVQFQCSNRRPEEYRWPGTVDFQNCQFPQLNRNYFELFPYMHKFIISDVGLEDLSMKVFSEAKHVTHLIADHNRITELPSHIFFNANRLKFLDFSYNRIQMIHSSAFEGANKLETLNFTQNAIPILDEKVFQDLALLKQLNVSHNNISRIDLTSLPVNLLELDLSNNSLSSLEHVFDKTTKLKYLNLAFNPIGNVKIETFAYMPDLEYLNLKRTNITSIEFGTFSHHEKLVFFDLSENHLKKLDFNLFMPILPELKSLSLAGNQLSDLSGFENKLFPQLIQLDIKGNDFNCSYLQRFITSHNWDRLRLPVDPTAVKPRETSIRSIKCHPIVQSSLEVEEPIFKNKTLAKDFKSTKSAQKLYGETYLIFMCIIMSSFLIMFVIANRERIFRPNGERNAHEKQSQHNVEYKTESLLLEYPVPFLFRLSEDSTMNLRTFCIFVICSDISAKFAISSPKYEHISACDNSAENCDQGCRHLNFTCTESDNESKLFSTTSESIKCSNGEYYRSRYGAIAFKNCRFREIDRNFFQVFKYLHTLNISDVELETLQIKSFRDAKQLTTLVASNNYLTEISAHLFVNAENLSFVDFSNNTIKSVDLLAFDGANSLKTLNLSHNFIDQLDSNSLSTPSLATVDLSFNNLTSLNEHTFGIYLKHLNLSCNPIRSLNIDTFAYLPNLEQLNLRRTNISGIQLGTFSHQHKLTSLDLTENNLKTLDFNVFLPVLHDLRSLFLGGNQLKELKGFRNALFPQLVLLDMKNNQFNCSYLQHFMETVNWEKLHLHIDPISVNTRQANIRGINCVHFDENRTAGGDMNNAIKNNKPESGRDAFKVENPNKSTEIGSNTSTTDQKSIDDIFVIKIALIFICIIMSTYLIVFLVLNRHRFANQPTVNYSGNSEHSNQVVEFSNEVLLIASQNRLKEIPSLLFVNAKNLTHVDFSKNTIGRIDPLAFAGANHIEFLDLSQNNLTEFSDQLSKCLTSIETLNLSHNAIQELNSLCAPNLHVLDLSFNKLTDLNKNTFNQTTKMNSLNLSFNSIGNLEVEIFAYMPDLKYLALRRTNLSSIRLGTFSHQHNLVSLDLSVNLLKELDFKLFMPVLHDLQTLRLAGNQLSRLNGFRNALFPKLELLDITDNRFNCSYLHRFMETINWEHLRLHLAPHSAGETNIGGVRCDDILYEHTDSETTDDIPNENKSLEIVLKETLSQLNQKTNDNIFTIIIILLVLISLILTANFTVFLILNRDRIRDQCLRTNFANDRPLSATYNTERAETLLL